MVKTIHLYLLYEVSVRVVKWGGIAVFRGERSAFWKIMLIFAEDKLHSAI